MIVKHYQNKRNNHKFLEVHEYDCGHKSVRQFMWFSNGVLNKLGDGRLHRWKSENLNELLNEYKEVTEVVL